MKKTLWIVTILCLMSSTLIGCNPSKSTKPQRIAPANIPYTENDLSYMAKVDSKSFYFYKEGQWQKEFIKGVNMGVGVPGKFPGEMAVTKEEYLRWFNYIGEMKANTLRVYTILSPVFYDALYEYNQTAQNKLFLIQGLWINEDDMLKYQNAYAPQILDTMKEDTKKIIDVLHGNRTIAPEPGHASGTYTKDISTYVLGFILGIEANADFVNQTNAKNPTKTTFNGQYLQTQTASPYEAFQADVGDYAISYETLTYKMQRPVAFTNWVTTDMLTHTNEPAKVEEDSAIVDPGHIKATKNFKPGLFASYHIYPYYPDFMNYQKENITYKNKEGKPDTYKPYLADLIKQHNMPVLVAEYGVPASRGMTHLSKMGFNQGMLSEHDQGTMDATMLQDIYDEGYAGALVFTWQDEWFKRSWNTMDFDLSDRRPFWSNPQASEQEFGLMAFDPGKDTSVCYVDGDISEWKNEKPLVSSPNLTTYVKSDEKYLYLRLNALNYDFEKDTLLIPIDSLPNQGNTTDSKYKVTLERPTDFVIELNGKENSRVVVDAYYDSFYYLYAKQLTMIKANSAYETKNSGLFNPENLALNKEITLPVDHQTIPFSSYETGKLLYGNGNPQSTDYNSLADFIFKDHQVEIRIPWALLNVTDPSTKSVMDNLYIGGIQSVKTSGFYIGGILLKENKVVESTAMNLYSWQEWETPSFHERLKPSYYILQDAFGKIK